MSNKPVENVVLGFATNLQAERLEVFAKTLRNVYRPQECDVVIITNRVDDQLCQLGQEYSVNFVYTPNNYAPGTSKFSKFLNRCILYPARWLALSTKQTLSLKVIFYEMYVQLLKLWHHPHFVRWFSYKDFLTTNPQYKRIFMSDVKDVAFQSPFFDEVNSADLHFYKQDVEYGGDDYWDTTWYRDSYGSKALDKVVGKPVFCIGTIMGSREGAHALLDVLCAEFLKAPFIGIEQSIFNHLFYTGAFDRINYKIHENSTGAVLTMTGKSWDRFQIRSDGVFIVDEKLAPVIHMYDRHQAAFKYFCELMGYAMKEDGLVKG